MGSLSTAPAVATGAADPPGLTPRSAGAGWHHNLETVDLAVLERLFSWLSLSRDAVRESPFLEAALLREHRALADGIDAALVTIYHELVVRGARGLFDGDVTLVDVADVRGPRCESPVCHLAHDVDGRHRKAAER